MLAVKPAPDKSCWLIPPEKQSPPVGGGGRKWTTHATTLPATPELLLDFDLVPVDDLPDAADQLVFEHVGGERCELKKNLQNFPPGFLFATFPSLHHHPVRGQTSCPTTFKFEVQNVNVNSAQNGAGTSIADSLLTTLKLLLLLWFH